MQDLPNPNPNPARIRPKRARTKGIAGRTFRFQKAEARAGNSAAAAAFLRLGRPPCRLVRITRYYDVARALVRRTRACSVETPLDASSLLRQPSVGTSADAARTSACATRQPVAGRHRGAGAFACQPLASLEYRRHPRQYFVHHRVW